MRVLVIEDNPIIAQALRRNFKTYYAIDICKNGKEGLLHAQTTAYDTILLDLNLPDISGEEICQELRSKGNTTPIIILSGKGEIKDKTSLLNMGADDYVTKPFNLTELRARINVAMRHTSNNSPAGKLYIDGLELDPGGRVVERYKERITLRRKEFELLELLMRHKGQTLTRSTILEHIWDMNENLWANVVDVHIKHLRDKVDRPYGTKLIKTVHGIGYKL
jgi:two-component system OmpR family response regulator